MPWMKQRRSSASVSKSCLLFICTVCPVISSSPWSRWDTICPFTCKGLNLSSKNRFPFTCSHLCIHQRGKGMESALARAGTKDLRSIRWQQCSWSAPLHLSLCISYLFLLPRDFSGKFYFASFILFLLRISQGKRSPTGLFWTDASQTATALKMILKIFSAVLYTTKNISTGNIWNINKSLF